MTRRDNIIPLHRAVDVSPWNQPEAYRPNLYDSLDPIDLRVEQLKFGRETYDLRDVLSDPFFIFFLGGSCGCLLTVVAAALWAGVL